MERQSKRREVLKLASGFAIAMAFEHAVPRTSWAQGNGNASGAGIAPRKPLAGDSENAYAVGHSSNFQAIYRNPQLSAAFILFLRNVYHLYPEERFHKLIQQTTQPGKSDRDVYLAVQRQLETIEPFLASVRYALPALRRQKEVMAEQTLRLLAPTSRINGYMEIGTTGRYIGKFKSRVDLRGDLVLVNADAASFSALDIVERGQLTKLGRFVSLNNYEPIAPAAVADGSLDVVANFIGFHHSPAAKRDGFVRSIHRVLRPGGKLILRDHDVSSDDMNRMVALAHDVFNLGLNVDWPVNQQEIRHFTSIEQIASYLDGFGLRMTKSKRPLFQKGDPTHNALMEFVKV